MRVLRQSTTSQEIFLGPFVDATDAVTAETALTIANTDIKLGKMGTTTLANKNSGGATHISDGVYTATLDDTDTNTPGTLEIFVYVAGALRVFGPWIVLPGQIYDSFFASDLLQVDLTQIVGAAVNTSSAQLGVNAVQISGDGGAADNAEAFFDGTGYAGTNNVIPTVTNVTNGVSLANNAVSAAAVATDAVTEIVTALLTTVMTEAYAADGAAPTLAQALFFIQQMLSEASVSGTTLTMKKLDGSTTAATFTLNSATEPTSITRAS